MIVLGVEFLLVLQFFNNRGGVNFIFLQTDQIQVSVRHGSVAISYYFFYFWYTCPRGLHTTYFLQPVPYLVLIDLNTGVFIYHI